MSSPPQAGNRTSARRPSSPRGRAPRRARRGRAPGRSRARCRRPPPACRSPSSAMARTTSPSLPASVIEIASPPCSSAFRDSSLKTSASAVARCPASSTGSSSAVTSFPATSPWTSIARSRSTQLGELDDVLAVLRQHLVHGGDREDPVDGVAERLPRIDALGARLQAQERRDGLEVVLDAVVDLLGEDAAQRHPTVLECHRSLVRDRVEELAVVVVERRVPVDDELADRPAAPAQRQPDRVRPCAALGPGDRARPRGRSRRPCVERLHRRLHDRLERLLEVERLRDRLGDPRERLQLLDPPPRLGVELRVLDRLRRPATAIDVRRSISASVNARGSRVRTLSAPSRTRGRGSAPRGSTRTRPRAGSGTP